MCCQDGWGMYARLLGAYMLVFDVGEFSDPLFPSRSAAEIFRCQTLLLLFNGDIKDWWGVVLRLEALQYVISLLYDV